MKALILAAGFGTRLLPYTKTLPKPLFSINSKPIIAHTIEKLINAGISEILVNTHHLHHKIEKYINENTFSVDVNTFFEPDILDTGGAVKNLKGSLENSTFLVINSDILFDFDLSGFIDKHKKNRNTASLVLHSHPQFNKIKIDKDNYIINFDSPDDSYAFTGIQILSPDVFKYMPSENVFSIIDLYKNLINSDIKVNSFLLNDNYFWEDIGSSSAYRYASMKYLAKETDDQDKTKLENIRIEQLAGDGSDREWFRLSLNNRTLIAADHGINIDFITNKMNQFNSFIKIGNHLKRQKIPAPEIYKRDLFSGIAITRDLGNIHLADCVNNTDDQNEIYTYYKKVCNELVKFSTAGIKNFKEEWTFETEEYSKEMILERECKYFLESFLKNFLNKNIDFSSFRSEFLFIADNAVNSSVNGLMHRDMQSKNIMINNNNIYFIDFQSARKGPIEYDAASLLIDPYVNLNEDMQKKILEYLIRILSETGYKNFDAKRFKHCYKYCSITRNLQILGAFSYLSRVKGKKQFENYIPFAVKTLKKNINFIDIKNIPELYNLINKEI